LRAENEKLRKELAERGSVNPAITSSKDNKEAEEKIKKMNE
jgi:hypothetical protein